MTIRQQFFQAFWKVVFLLIYTGLILLLPHILPFQSINNDLLYLVFKLTASFFYAITITFCIPMLFPVIHTWLHKIEPTYHSMFSYRQFVAKLKWFAYHDPQQLVGRKIVFVLENGNTIHGAISSFNDLSLFLDTGESIALDALFESRKRYDRFYGHFSTFINRIFLDIENIPSPAP